MAPMIFHTGDTTVSGPALVLADNIVLAWAAGGGLGGAPPNLRINIRHGWVGDPGGPSSWPKVVLNEYSAESVALSTFGGRVWLGWTGTDGVGRFNLLSGANAKDLGSSGDKQTFADTCLGGPALAAHRGMLVRAWTGGGGLGGGPADRHLNLAWSGDGRNWPDQNRIVLPHVGVSGPDLINFRDLAGDEYLYLAWTDAEQHIFVARTTNGKFHELAGNVVRIETDGRTEHSFAAPRLAAMLNDVLVTWPEAGGGHNISVMNANIPNLNFAFKRTWGDESAVSGVATLGFPHSLVYAYRGTDGVGGLYIGSRQRNEV